jgi:hydroxymethylbilane synthase
MNDLKLANETVRLGSRRSELALWQCHYIEELLKEVYPALTTEVKPFITQGDKILNTPLTSIGGKGLFTAELEGALLEGAIDAAVHSLKDLPVETPDGLTLGAIPKRANPADVLVSSRGYTLESLPKGAAVGTSSRRRAAQILAIRPDVSLVDIRGNIPTRIRKALDKAATYDAIVLAHAGLARLGRLDVVSQVLDFDQMLPSPGQGALAVQCRDDDSSKKLFLPLDEAGTRSAVTAERSFLSGLGGGCGLPISAYATVIGNSLLLQGRVSAVDGSKKIDVNGSGSPSEAWQLGQELAQEALGEGADILLADIAEESRD